MLLRNGDVVWCTVVQRHPWGVIVSIDGEEEVGASVDLFQIGLPPRSMADVPEMGTRLRAVIAEDRYGWLRLSHRPDHVAHAERTGEPPWPGTGTH